MDKNYNCKSPVKISFCQTSNYQYFCILYKIRIDLARTKECEHTPLFAIKKAIHFTTSSCCCCCCSRCCCCCCYWCCCWCCWYCYCRIRILSFILHNRRTGNLWKAKFCCFIIAFLHFYDRKRESKGSF